MSSDRIGPYISFHENVVFVKNGTRYPHCCMVDGKGRIVHPVKERIMSLAGAPRKAPETFIPPIVRNEHDPVFFFIYNTDNYFHFLYDTLPYLLSFEHLRKINPGLKLLMQRDTPMFYPFVEETLRLLGIDPLRDVTLAEEGVMYANVSVSDSYTHGLYPNDPPRQEIFKLYDHMIEAAAEEATIDYPKKFYVSRRSWLHGDVSNMGTNYTTRRRLVNEDQVVELLASKGYEEVFTERMSTVDKVNLFAGATHVVGAIGGGVSNCLFSRGADLLALVSPTFLEVNGRFVHSFSRVKARYLTATSHVDTGPFKKYMRIHSNGLVGEIEEIYDDSLLVYYTKEQVAGWNSEGSYDRIVLKKDECTPLDDGLNSPWKVDIDVLEEMVR